jgi:Uncharacterized conserved protein (COG2071)
MNVTMIGRISDCVLLAYRTPTATVAHLLPSGLQLVTHGPWAFWNIVACRVEAMRPTFCPRWLGSSYLHVAYRLYVRAHAQSEVLDGLYFVRSDADSLPVSFLGNRATDFRFHKATIALSVDAEAVSLSVSGTRDGIANARLRAGVGSPTLTTDSCFESYASARQFLKYRPIALSPDRRGNRVKVAEVIRDESKWRESPLRVLDARWGIFDRLAQHDAHLELATRVQPLDYCWRLGRSYALRRTTNG